MTKLEFEKHLNQVFKEMPYAEAEKDFGFLSRNFPTIFHSGKVGSLIRREDPVGFDAMYHDDEKNQKYHL